MMTTLYGDRYIDSVLEQVESLERRLGPQPETRAIRAETQDAELHQTAVRWGLALIRGGRPDEWCSAARLERGYKQQQAQLRLLRDDDNDDGPDPAAPQAGLDGRERRRAA